MDPPPTPTPNRRRSIRRKPRHSTKVEIRKGTLGLGPNLAVSVLDISETGARVLVKSELLKGEEVELLFQGIGHRKPCKAIGEVMWCVETPEKNFCIGILFRKNLPYAELQQLL